MSYKNVFIDLDRTLWDFETNSTETIEEIFYKYKINKICKFEEFHSVYRKENDVLWKDYREKRIEKDVLSCQRFFLSLKHFDYENKEIAVKMSEDYIKFSPMKTKMFDGSVEILQYLSAKYQIYLVTNGFIEVQYNKIKNCGIDKYFDAVFTSEEVGCNKPNIEYFQHVIKNTGSLTTESIIIGDDIEVDIKGAAKIGIDTLWCNFANQNSDYTPTYEVKSLLEIKNIL